MQQLAITSLQRGLTLTGPPRSDETPQEAEEHRYQVVTRMQCQFVSSQGKGCYLHITFFNLDLIEMC